MNQMTSGGAERVVSILANQMVELNYSISLVITFQSTIDYYLDDRIEVITFNISKNMGQIKRNIEEVKKLRDLFKERRPDLVISFIRNVNTILAAKTVNIPVIVSERNNPIFDPNSKVWRIARHISYPFADGIVFQTTGAKNYFNKFIQKKSIIINNPLSDNIEIKHNKYSSKKIISVGRLTSQKDQEMLIKAFNIFKKNNKGYKLIIYGEGPLRENLQKQIDNLNLSNDIEMPGSTKNIYKKMEEADLFILSSKYEGYPNALIEAMATGLPVISTRCKFGPEDIIINNINGILVDVGDYIDLSEQMERIIKNDNFKYSLGKNAIKIREKLNVNKIVNEWIDFINKNLNK